MQGNIADGTRRRGANAAAGRLGLAREPASDIAFLAAHGIAPGVLLQAEALGRAEGCPASSCLIAHDLIDETTFYTLLARHLGLQLVEGPVQPSAQTKFDQAWDDGFLELEQGGPLRWLLAPQGRDIAVALASREALRAAGAAFALMTPTRFRALLMARFADEISEDACQQLAQSLPAMCNAPAPLRGAMPERPRLYSLPLALLSLALSAVLSITFLVGNWLKLAACLLPGGAEPPDAGMADKALPTYTIIVALYHEEHVVADLAAALQDISYPKSRLSVIFVVEQDDAATRQALERLSLPQRFAIVTAPAGMPRTKPRALNVALRQVRSDFLTIYDAEDRPSPRQLRAAAAQFAASAPKIACLQAALVIDNAGETWLTRLFALEYAVLFDIINPLLAASGLVMPLGGTSNHFRVAALKACHGWDAWNVTEDADLGFRLARLGYGVATLRSDTHEEAPLNWRAWLHQRRRWQKGWLQTALVHLRHPQALMRDLGPGQAMIAATWLGTMVLGPLFGPFLAIAGLAHVASSGFFSPGSLMTAALNSWILFIALTGSLAMTIPMLLALWHRRLWACAVALPLLPLYLCLITLAAWLALYDLVTAPHHWRKTAHGLTRQPRTAPL
ncbi:MAG: glycosyltransferase [Hyphomicrobiales bacterium]|nr:glycosyltransferase [Hyphomicrobiales bacterium]